MFAEAFSFKYKNKQANSKIHLQTAIQKYPEDLMLSTTAIEYKINQQQTQNIQW